MITSYTFVCKSGSVLITYLASSYQAVDWSGRSHAVSTLESRSRVDLVLAELYGGRERERERREGKERRQSEE